jgi:hypothetical protein
MCSNFNYYNINHANPKKISACATSWTKIEQWKTSKTTERFKMTIKLQHIAKISACLGSGHSESMIWGV